MSDKILVQFVGFESGAHARIYTFTVRQPSAEPRDFTLAITNQAFTDHLISYQDAPNICSLKLHRELAANANHPSKTRLDITGADIEDYRSTHAPRKVPPPFPRKAVED